MERAGAPAQAAGLLSFQTIVNAEEPTKVSVWA